MDSPGGSAVGRGKGSGPGGTSGSGSSTGPGCTAGRISASAVHRRQTRGPGHSLGRAPVTEEPVTRWPAVSGWSGDPTSQDDEGRRRPACQHRAPAGTELCQSLNKQALMQSTEPDLGHTRPPLSRRDLDPGSAYGCFRRGRTVPPLLAGVPRGPQGALGRAQGAGGVRSSP